MTDKGRTKTSTLAKLYSEYAGWLRGTLERRFGGANADDLVQETYLRFAKAHTAVVHHPRAMLIKIAVNAARDQHRRATAHGSSFTVRLEDAYDSSDASIRADQLENLLLKQVILSLPELYRDVFVLSRFGGLTYEEIASHCGLSVKTVEWRMSKALALCAAQLAK